METSQADADRPYRVLSDLFVPISAELRRYAEPWMLRVERRFRVGLALVAVMAIVCFFRSRALLRRRVDWRVDPSSF